MKLIKHYQERLVFGLSKREQSQLLNVLTLYPRVPPAHHRLSKTGCLPQPVEAQKLLEEALAEQRRDNRKTLELFLSAPGRFTESATSSRFTLSETEAEWLLQILNDVRIGSWVLIGSPENVLKALTPQTAPSISAMEIAGFFQANLLQALSEGSATSL